nr:reverse transcriptase domain-containing protein [Tanacetum cinerariifolium]
MLYEDVVRSQECWSNIPTACDKAFETHIGYNLKVYVDDLVIQNHTEHEIFRDIKEMFHNLRRINMKLIPKKCTFGAEEGVFLGHVVNLKGVKACLEKAEAVMKLQSPQTLKEAQSLNKKLASLNRFISKSTKKSLSFFKTLKSFTKKSDFQWTLKVERAFQGMKQCIVEQPMVTTPRPKEELIVYLCAAREVILSRSENTGRRLKWKFKLEGFDITYKPRTSIRGQVLAAFIAERPDEEGLLMEAPAEENMCREAKRKSRRAKQNRVHKLRPLYQTSPIRNTKKEIDKRTRNLCRCERRRILLDDIINRIPCGRYPIGKNKEGTCNQDQGKTIYHDQRRLVQRVVPRTMVVVHRSNPGRIRGQRNP